MISIKAIARNGVESEVKPFLRWAGGKRRIVHQLSKYLPKSNFDCYWEPFLGAGAMFFHLAPKLAVLSDSNEELIACYQEVRNNPDLIVRYLREHSANSSENYYYKVRKAYNSSRRSSAQAARFIYLNKTSFNGIFRVNVDGHYNVPYGRKEPPALPSVIEIRQISELLSRADIQARSYEAILDDPRLSTGHFVYLDPPYPPLNDTAYFTHYTAERFAWEDQKKVASLAAQLRSRGCHVMVSNADSERVRALYESWHYRTLPVVRWVAANGTRHKASEIVFTSYSPE